MIFAASTPPRRPFYRILLSATGVTFAVYALALLRQSLTVKYFGLSRDLDLFWTLYAMANVSVFPFNVVVESAFTALVTRIKESDGDLEFRKSLRPFALASLGIGIIASVAFAVVVPLLGLLYAAGFSTDEKQRLFSLAWWFLPWIVAIVAYYAVAALLRSAWSYSAAFFGELLVMVVSISILLQRHDDIADLPLAYSAGYVAALLWLLARVLSISEPGASKGFPVRDLVRRAMTHYSANQFTTIAALAERFWMSFVPAGGIAAMAAVQQLIIGIGGLLSFRDAYLAPLALEAGRAARLRRLIVGMFLVSGVVAAFVASTAPEIVALLFQYGKATRADAALIARLLTVGSVTLVSSTVGALIWRVLQMTGNHRTFIRTFTANGVITFMLAWLLVGKLGLGIVGIAMAGVVTSFMALAAAFVGARQLECRLKAEDWQLGATAIVVLPLLAAFSANVGRLAPNPMLALILGGSLYTAGVGALAYPMRARLLRIIKGGT